MGSNHTLIAKGARFVGDLQFTGELNIQGKLMGTILADGDSELEISQSGHVEGQIQVPKVIVRGHVHGDIHCFKHIELSATAVISGNVFYRVIEVVKGAQVNGNLVYVEEQPQPAAGKTKKVAESSS